MTNGPAVDGKRVRRVFWSASVAISLGMIAAGIYLSASSRFALQFKGYSPKPGLILMGAGLILGLLTVLHLRRHK